jgi:hypothetical protein
MGQDPGREAVEGERLRSRGRFTEKCTQMHTRRMHTADRGGRFHTHRNPLLKNAREMHTPDEHSEPYVNYDFLPLRLM